MKSSQIVIPKNIPLKGPERLLLAMLFTIAEDKVVVLMRDT